MVSLKDYYRKPYMFDDYSDMIAANSNETVRDAIADIRKFEFLKPYVQNEEDKVETDYSRIVNEYTLPSNKILTLYLLKDEGNFTLDYKRYHPPNKSHMCPEIPDPWGETFVKNIQGYTYRSPTATPESGVVTTTPIHTTSTSKPVDQYSSGTDRGYLHWKVKPQSEVTRDTEYILEVFNGFNRSYKTKNGTVIKDVTRYKQPFFSLIKNSSDAKGVKLLQRFRFNALGDYSWYDVTSDEFKFIRDRISNNQITNLMQNITISKLVISPEADGKYRIKVSDGITTLSTIVTFGRDYFYKGTDDIYYLIGEYSYPIKKCVGATVQPFVDHMSGNLEYVSVRTYTRTTTYYHEEITGYTAFLYPPEGWQTESWWNFKYWNTAWTNRVVVEEVIESTDPDIEDSVTLVSDVTTNGTSYWGGYTNVFGYSAYWWPESGSPNLPTTTPGGIPLSSINPTDTVTVVNTDDSTDVYISDASIELVEGVVVLLPYEGVIFNPSDGDVIYWDSKKDPEKDIFFLDMYPGTDPSDKTYFWVYTGIGFESGVVSITFKDPSFDGVYMNLSNVYYGNQ